MNEHRGGVADFDGRSVFDSPSQRSNYKITEQGFIGTHADIGGGYGTGDLSDVTLMWMIEAAKTTGVTFKEETLAAKGWNEVTNPILHDKSLNQEGPKANWMRDDREFVYGDGTSVKQAKATSTGMTTAQAREMVTYSDSYCGVGKDNPQVGVVDMKKYAEWLKEHISGFEISYQGGAQPCP